MDIFWLRKQNATLAVRVAELESSAVEREAAIEVLLSERAATIKDLLERMRCDSCRERGMQIGSGIVESSCRHIVGVRLKRPGSRRTFKGANAMLAINRALANKRWVDCMD